MTSARVVVLAFALLLAIVLVGGLIAIASGADALPFVLAAAVPAVGLQIARRRASGMPVFALRARTPQAR
jgi:hypothetical protein